MAGIVEEIKRGFRQGHWLERIIYLNLGIYILYLVLRTLSFLFQFELGLFFVDWMALPSDLSRFITRPWTLVTYMFLHTDFFHILFNLLVLFLSGRIFIDFLGDKRLLSVYVLGGIAGGALFVLAYNLLPAFSQLNPILGASAGVMAILIAIATKAPSFPVRLFFVLEVKLWHIAALLVIMDIAQMPIENPGGHIAHLGGALFGFAYIRALDRGKDWSNAFWDTLRWFRGLFVRKPRLRTVHKADKKTRQQQNKTTYSEQERMNAILDKIKDHGYEKLSREEKAFLFQYSRK